MLSIIIPSCTELFLQKTVDSLLNNAEGQIEILVVFDGYKPKTPLRSNENLRLIYLDQHKGMRAAINEGIKESMGEYIMKIDEHCAIGKGYDVVLTDNCAYNWLVVPRRYSLDEANFTKKNDRPILDYCYFTFPKESTYGVGLSIQDWHHKMKERFDPKYDIDDLLMFQGSCWLVNKKYFMEHIGYLDDNSLTYGSFCQEAQEIGFKYWLGGGEVKVVKKTWYAHLKKTARYYQLVGWLEKAYKKDTKTPYNNTWSARHWMNDEEPNMINKFEWLIDKFSPIPTWEPNWKEIWKNQKI